MIKFRSMIPNAEAVLKQLMKTDPKIREEYTIHKKLRQDPRITAAGEFLRKTSLDEFPQLINVLKGEMKMCIRDSTWYASVAEVQGAMLAGKADVALMAEPAATATIAKAKEKGQELKIVMDPVSYTHLEASGIG